MSKSPEEFAHQEWLGYVQPVGLVVSIPAMLEAQCYVNKNIMPEHAQFLSCLPRGQGDERVPELRDLPEFTRKVLGWEAEDLNEIPARGPLAGDMAELEVILPQYHETLRPTFVVWEWKSGTRDLGLGIGSSPQSPTPQPKSPMMLIQEVATGCNLDEPDEADSARHWNAAPQAKFERLLRETGVPIGLLSNRRQLRLVYAPKGESSGYATFHVQEMMQVAGRPMFAALHMLLCADRMFSLGDNQRLPAILHNSRKYQNTVSTKLAEQVLAALYELMRGFQAANDVRNGDLLRDVLANDPNHVYAGLLRVLMRLVFVMYAEDRDLLSSDPIYSNFYSVTGLFNRLREDAGRHPDTMNQRYGAWSQLLTLFRLIYEGGQHGDFRLPARKGYLFDPDRYPFLEGRASGLGTGDWGKKGLGDDRDSVVSRSEGLAAGDGPDSRTLSGDEIVSEGGDLRPDQSDPSGSQLDTGEHRGGAREGHQGVSAVSEDRSGEPDRTGNPSDDRSKSRHSVRGRSGLAARSNRTTRANAEQAAGRHQPLSPNPQPQIPRVSDGVVYKVLRNLLILDGERLSYRTLDVEQIGSVYETVMGFNLEVARGRSIAIKPVKSHGAPATINLAELLKTPGKDRAKWLKEHSDQTLGKEAAKQLKEAESLEQLLEALDKKIARKVTPRTVPKGAIVLQPSDERRRSGSHYTPRSLTEPIVRTTLEPILKSLCDGGLGVGDSGLGNKEGAQSPGPDPQSLTPEAVWEPTAADRKRFTTGEIAERIRLSQQKLEYARLAREKGIPHPAQILDLKICDPAMGSGAFLVEACRQLADHLVESWAAHSESLTPNPQSLIPPDEDEVLYARRQVAQRCLYGVDKNEMAVDLAKLSLWLVTLAKDHPFTFLDHSLRHGDSLVGLTRKQIIGFHWEPKKQKQFGEDLIQKRLDRATEARAKILNAREDVPYRDQEQRLALADEALNVVRMTGDACVSAFFAGKKPKEREKLCEELFLDVARHFQALKDDKFDVEARSRIANAAASLRTGAHPIPPFHWEIEYPEVFSRANGGFDAFVGNPPFAGKNTLHGGNRTGFVDWLKTVHVESHGNSDLVAHFFRRAFNLLRVQGTFGLIATKTIGQGDTRSSGLRWICVNGGTIYHARRRMKWPGLAAVIVSVVNLVRGRFSPPYDLDGRLVDRITAYLFHAGGHESPPPLMANSGKSFQGVIPLGMGFTFDDDSDEATPISVMQDLISEDPRNNERIFPFIGWDEVATDPLHSPDRYIIDFEEMSEQEARRWPQLMAIVEAKVKPARFAQNDKGGRQFWWRFLRPRGEMREAIRGLDKVLVTASQAMTRYAFALVHNRAVFSSNLTVIADDQSSTWGVMQSQVHEAWARAFCATLKDDLAYAPTDGFDNFPFPFSREVIDFAAKNCLGNRSQLMATAGEGLTKTYNRFHDPHEKSPEILKLRELHEAMDRAVLEAYGWHDLAQTARCEFLLDYEEEGDGDSGLGTGGKNQSLSPKPQSRRRKPYRLRWPDDFRDEVLARLLELNEQRHQEELLAGKQLGKAEKPPKPAKANQPKKPKLETSLFDMDEVSSIDQLTESERMTLVIISAWGEGTMIDRLLFGEAAVLWVNDKHRQYRCGESSTPQKRFKPAPDVTQLIGNAVRRGWITPVMRGEIECVKLIVNPSPLGPLTDDEEAKRRQICQIVAAELNRTDPRVQKGDDYVRATALFARS